MNEGWDTVAAWHRRDKDVFGGVAVYDDGRPIPIVRFKRDRGRWSRWPDLCRRWIDLDGVSAAIDAIDFEVGALLLRYPAIDWTTVRIEVDSAGKHLASWLVDLADTYKMLGQQLGDDIALFCAPRVKIDLASRVRLVFLPDAPDRNDAPPEVQALSPRWDERSAIYMAASLTRRLVFYRRGPASDLIDRCTHRNPDKRFKTVKDFLHAVEKTFDVDVVKLRRRDPLYVRFEEGLGWLELGDGVRANAALMEASESDALREEASEYRVYASILQQAASTASYKSPLPPSFELNIPQHELLPRARRSLQSGDVGFAATLAHEIRKTDPDNDEAASILVTAHLKNERPHDALAIVDELLSRSPSAKRHYLRAKVLFAARRLHEAKDAFELAFKLDPMMLEAMLLRRETERAIGSLRDTVGEGNATVRIPVALEALRSVLLSGDVASAIVALRHPRYSTDPEAQLVLARFLALDGQHQEALDVFDRVTSDQHRFAALLGKTSALLAMGRDESALALLDELVTEKPTDAEASEGRARALEKLGRIGEAAAEYRRFISLATAGSDLRVRAAQAWLDEHPL